jgi:hypothetical protein
MALALVFNVNPPVIVHRFENTFRKSSSKVPPPRMPPLSLPQTHLATYAPPMLARDGYPLAGAFLWGATCAASIWGRGYDDRGHRKYPQ